LANAQPFHHGKARGIGKGKVFIGIGRDDLPRPLLITGADLDNRGA
jgi:hypothetical protein